ALSSDFDHLTFEFLTATKEDNLFHFDHNMVKTINSFTKVMFENCHCHFHEMFSSILEKYLNKYRSRFQGKSREEVIEVLKNDFIYVKDTIVDAFSKSIVEDAKDNVVDNVSTKLTGIYGFSVEGELERLI